jgi:hypothetical protein
MLSHLEKWAIFGVEASIGIDQHVHCHKSCCCDGKTIFFLEPTKKITTSLFCIIIINAAAAAGCE